VTHVGGRAAALAPRRLSPRQAATPSLPLVPAWRMALCARSLSNGSEAMRIRALLNGVRYNLPQLVAIHQNG
jgi:hypothetical protein